MSRENVEVVRRMIEAFNKGELKQAALDLHPDVEWEPPQIAPDASTHHGREGVMDFWTTWRESFGDLRLEVDEYIDAGSFVVVVTRALGHGSGSGVGTATPPFFQLVEVSGGKIIGNRMYLRLEDALAAAGVGGR